MIRIWFAVVLASALCVLNMHAETGANAWLRYAAPPDPPRYHDMPHAVVQLGSAPEEQSAAEELDRGLGHMISGTDDLLHQFDPTLDSIILGTTEAIHRARLDRSIPGWHEQTLAPEAFRIVHLRRGKRQWWVLQGGSPRAELYAAFHFMALVAEDRQLPSELIEQPAVPIRWVTQKDMWNGSVPQGYAGRSIFFEGGRARDDLHRVSDYGRLLASVGINGLVLSGVDAASLGSTPQHLADLGRIAAELRPWGVRVVVSALPPDNPEGNGDHRNVRIPPDWTGTVEAIYRAVPDLGGFVLDEASAAPPSEDPHASAAEVSRFASPLQPHGGRLLLRLPGIHAQDRPNPEESRLAEDVAMPPNVTVVSAWNGTMPPPLHGIQHISTAIEVNMSQAFTGQQRHLNFLVPAWKTLLDTDLHIAEERTSFADIVRGARTHTPPGGYVAVANVGADANWMHHPMNVANLYGFGRLAWDPSLPAEQIADEWTRQSWSDDARIYEPIERMLLGSGEAYRNYTGPLGLGPLTGEAEPHFGPDLEASRSHTGATHSGVGIDGEAVGRQYPPQFAARLQSIATCPQDLLLATHHLAYSDRLPSGKTVIQTIYDAHYAGAGAAAQFVDEWEQLRDLVDEPRFNQVHALLALQASHAEIWRDAVNDWFHRESGIADALGYVGNHPGRTEAEVMQSTGYVIVPVTPWETASGGQAVLCHAAPCSLQTIFRGDANVYRVEVGYYDLHPGSSGYTLLVNHVEIAHWNSADTLPPGVDTARPDGNTAVTTVTNGVRLRAGDTVELRAGEGAVDYLEITRDPRWN